MNEDAIEAEFKAVLVSIINYVLLLNVNPENALEGANKKISNGFNI